MHQILIPTDFSRAAQNAVDYAFSFFREEPCSIHLLNTYTPDFIHSRVMALTHGKGPQEDIMQSASEEGLSILAQTLQMRYPKPGHDIQTVSSFNLLTEEIKEQVALHDIDLIISGTTGASGMKEVFLGSNTVRILRVADQCPVLAVPADYKFKERIKIGLVTDFGTPYTASQIAVVLKFQKRLQAKVEVMHIGSPEGLSSFQELHKHQLFLELERLQPEMQWRWPQTSKAQVIGEYLNTDSVDLLIMIRNEHHLVEELLREPVVRKVAFHTKVPMLVLPPTHG
ncbi:MAG: universal stress protein [Robiginitalea sp.]|jgi:nucleotide-binding universal stress UspA family protein